MTQTRSTETDGRPVTRLLSAMAVALGLAPAATMEAEPQTVAPHAAPKAWIDYATLVSGQVQARLASDDPAAARLRQYLDQLPGAAGADGVTLRIAFWIDGTGMIDRVDFPLFAHPEPNDDLKALMVGLRLGEAPPKGMLLPLRLTVQVKPKDEPKPRPQAWNGRWTTGAVRVSYGTSSAGGSPQGRRG